MIDLLKALLATLAFLTFISNAAWARPPSCHEFSGEAVNCGVLCWKGHAIDLR
jgi:hypothetical protein